MLVSELEIVIPVSAQQTAFPNDVEAAVRSQLPAGFQPILFVVVESDLNRWRCEIGGISASSSQLLNQVDEIFNFNNRKIVRNDKFNAVVLVPTGIGAEVGG